MNKKSRWFAFHEMGLDPLLMTLLGVFYLFHLYPSLWWGDGPELITAALCDGIAHPTGYPVYLILFKSFSSLPLGSAIWKGNLFSLTCTLGGFICLARLIPVSQSTLAKAMGWRFGLVGLALSPLIWSQTLVVEVYTFSFFLMAFSLWLGKRFLDNPSLLLLSFTGLVVGLGVGHHRLLAFLVPGFALWMAPAFHDNKRRGLWLVPASVLFLFGIFLPYSLLYFRAQGSPPINWGNPSTLENLWAVFSAEQYRMDQKVFHLKRWVEYSVGVAPTPWQTSLLDLARTPARIWHNYGLAGILGLVGVVGLACRDIRLLLSGLVAWVLPTLFIVQYHVGDQESFHLTPYVVLGCLVAYGWAIAIETVWKHSKYAIVFLLLLGGMQIVGQTDQLQTPPENVALSPERYARRTLNRVEPGAALFIASDQWDLPADFLYFPILYHHHVAQRRTDVAVVSEGYFTSPWYRSSLERQGLSGAFFDHLETGNEKVEVIKTDFKTYIRDELPVLMEGPKDKAEGTKYQIYLVEGRPYFLNRETLAILAAEYLFPQLLERTLYSTAKFEAIDPFLEKKIEWKPVDRVPIDVSGYPPLRGEPLPSGNLYRVEILDTTSTP